MKKALVVQTDGKSEIVEFNNDNSLAVLQKAVDGLIQPVDVRPPNLTMWCNEEGLFRNDFTENFMATAIYEDAVGVDNQCILGPVVFTGGTDPEGYTEGLNDQMLELVMRMAEVQRQALEQLYKE